MKRLFIHIGTHKTGSTAIQYALKINQDLLSKQGYSQISDICDLVRELKRTSISNTQRSSLHAQIKKKVSSQLSNNVIISSEQFSGTIMKNYQDSGFLAEQLIDMFHDFQVSIIIYCRRQDSFIESAYTQFIHQGECWSFEEFSEKVNFGGFDWALLAKNYSNRFPDVTVRIYEKNQLYKGDVAMDFFKLIGISESYKIKVSNGSHYSYSAIGLKLARFGNRYLSSSNKRKLFVFLQMCFSKQPFDRFKFFNDAERHQLLTGYKGANENLKEFIKNPNELLFSDLD